MPARTVPQVRRWNCPPVTRENVDWAQLATIDLARARTPEGRAEQVEIARDAMHKQGFFYVVNHGFDLAENQRMIDIASVAFEEVDDEEKARYQARIKETGTYLGYKLPQYWVIANGVRDRITHYNFPRNVHDRNHPEALRPYLPEIQEMVEFTHCTILHEVQKLLSLGLELPENTLSDMHPFDDTNHSFWRFMLYDPRSEEEERKTEGVWMKGHADHMSFTALWSQPVTALQIKDHDGQWRYVKHVENAVIINCGDFTEYLTGGYYKSAVHRVIKPPADQEGYRRLNLIYFGYTSDNVVLRPLLESPVIQRTGLTKVIEGEHPTMEKWRKTRTAVYGVSELKKAADGSEYEIVNGVKVTHHH
ncbi:Clavaminate synthase-like protein [Vararia minispora EC-137]|uniref:Clavaminate synthase-like protein n=1 Tax=Vararia minispora EC-137 TaxID=1314806 RepID=A0ACB8QUX6_9AGAM|nr:Clavaminate synthase-like protein [Vararia minispora EC-137]